MAVCDYLLPIHLAARTGGLSSPVCLEVDFTRKLREVGATALVDVSNLRLETGEGTLPAQFSPAVDFDAHARCRGTVAFRLPRGLRAPLDTRLRCTANSNLTAALLPFPPRAYRHHFADGRAAPLAFFARMQLTPGADASLAVEDHGSLVTTYQHGPQLPKPFLYPLIGPAGRPLTRLEQPHDLTGRHRHHRATWVGFRGVNGINFWEEHFENSGTLVHRRFLRMEEGPIFARFVAEVSWNGPEGAPVLLEERDVTVYAGEEQRVIDLQLRLRGAQSDTTFAQTSFGFLGVRVARSMGVLDGGGEIRGSEGGLNEGDLFWKPARWCDYTGPVTPDAWNGVALLDYPSNPGHPVSWHVRGDGWMGPSHALAAGFVLPAGEILTLRYRLLTHAGTAHQADVERAWQEYAAPPEAELRSMVTAVE